jgi:hypothetical protein
MRRARRDVDGDFGDLPYFGNDSDEVPLGIAADASARGDTERPRAARQRVELRNEQKSLRQQLSDWDDYSEDFDTSL